MTLDEERMRASEARHGAAAMRRAAYDRHDDDCATRCDINHRLGGKCRVLHHCDKCAREMAE